MKNYKIVSNKLIVKLGVSFLLIIFIIGIVYVLLTFYFVEKFYSKTTQVLNNNVARHLVEEKFKNISPFLEDGSVNSLLFDDIMHDMMAVNRAIEVYLLNESGEVLYSVVLDKNQHEKKTNKVDVKPIKEFLGKEADYILGDDPRDLGAKKIFSAAHFTKGEHKGYIYILF